jgi:hypothetical protein
MKHPLEIFRDLKLRMWKLLSALPFGNRLLRWRLNKVQKRRFLKIGDTKAVFSHHYQNNNWGDAESASGPGSTLAYTENLRKELPLLVDSFQINSILDAPCGDFNWMRQIEWRNPIKYIGADIVDEIVEKNNMKFSSQDRVFFSLDITRDTLPNADLWLCRDCLFHLSNEDIFLALRQFKNSNLSFLLTSTHPECRLNLDIPTGSFRLLNLQAAPFLLPEPVKWIDDWIPGQPVRKLGLWTRPQIQGIIKSSFR